MGGVGTVQNPIEIEAVWFEPLLVACDDEVLRAHGKGILPLTWAVREHGHLGTESDSPEDGEVAKTTHAW